MELEFINKYLKPIAGKNSLLLSDDCAVFGEYVITCDVLTSGTHFFENDDPYNLARKALRVNLSDLAAMGAEPFGFMLGLSLPRNVNEGWLAKFTQGLEADIKKYNFQLLGGDTTTHDAGLNISVTAIGKTPQPILRKGAKPGDNIFVSGKIGESYIGLQHKKIGAKTGYFVEKYELPEPQVELGIKLRDVATSCIDISDGLLLDLWRLCQVSGVGAKLESAKIPVPESEYSLQTLISAGDDYQLLFTSPADSFENCYKIGTILADKQVLIDDNVAEIKGYIHS